MQFQVKNTENERKRATEDRKHKVVARREGR